MKPPPNLTLEERTLLAALEPHIREAIWSSNLSNGPLYAPGKWITRSLKQPLKLNAARKPTPISLKADSASEDFLESCCIFGGEHLHTVTAVYWILRDLKKRGLLSVQGFECTDVRPPSKVRE
jgi:hypothetical protein